MTRAVVLAVAGSTDKTGQALRRARAAGRGPQTRAGTLIRSSMPRGTTTVRRGLVVLLALAALGCAQRADWVEGTLVTVDVSGVWRGRVTGGIQGEMEMTLSQQGPKVTGEGRVRAEKIRVEGTVRGDVFSFADVGGRLRAEATVSGDEMSGSGRTNITYPQAHYGFLFKLSR